MGSTNRLTSSARRLGISALAGLLAVGGLAGWTQPSASGATAPRAAAAAAGEGDEDWTVMVYEVADTSNIANDMVLNLASIAAIPEMENVNIVAMIDLPEQTDPGYPQATLPGVAPFTTTKLVVLEDGRWNEIRDLGEVSMGRPDVLASFIEESADRYPASKYGLILSDHGGAYTGGYIDNGPPSTSGLSVEGMREGIVTGMQRGGIDKFDFISHDSCLMASYETVSALGPLADVHVASEEVIAGSETLDLDAMALLGENASGEEWGQANISGYADQADAVEGLGVWTAMSVVDGDAMERLDEAVESFSEAAIANMDVVAPELGRARGRVLEFVTGMTGDDGGLSVVDLGDLLRQLENVPPEVEVARDAVFAALDAAVLHQETRQATEQATGLNVFFPDSPQQARDYVDQSIAPPGWNNLVQAYADFASSGGSGGGGGGGGGGGNGGDGQAQFASEDAQVLEIGSGGIRIAGTLLAGDEADVVDTETQVYTQIGGRDALAVVLPAYLNSGGQGQVQGVWNFSVTTLQAGNKQAAVSAVYSPQAGGLLGWFQAVYTAPDGSQTDVEVQVLLSSQGEIESVTVSDISLGAQAGIELENGGTLTPYLIVPSSGGFAFELSSESVPVNDKTQVAYPKLPVGTPFEMFVGVLDLAGGFNAVGVSETVK